MTTFVRDQLPGNPCSGFAVIGASGGNIGHVQLFNPVASGILVHLHFIAEGSTQAPTLAVYFHDVALTTLGVSQKLTVDRRSSTGPFAELRTQLNATLLPTVANTIGSARRAAGTSYERELIGNWVLLPGQGFVLSPNLVNASVESWWMWSETFTV